jgi:hypothetical protein
MVDRLGKSSQPGETFFHTGNYRYPGFSDPQEPAQPDGVTLEPGEQE